MFLCTNLYSDPFPVRTPIWHLLQTLYYSCCLFKMENAAAHWYDNYVGYFLGNFICVLLDLLYFCFSQPWPSYLDWTATASFCLEGWNVIQLSYSVYSRLDIFEKACRSSTGKSFIFKHSIFKHSISYSLCHHTQLITQAFFNFWWRST